ncbi:hypothetical protein Leryth_023871 [Lithospermum erythrorhizon]|nr:hypothetical protein Leryth_023871 [Lithospermum erythrorhizon]
MLVDLRAAQPARHLLRIDGPKEPKESVQTPKLVVYVDRARNSKGVGAGIMIQGPDQVKTKYTLRFSFEAMISGDRQ